MHEHIPTSFQMLPKKTTDLSKKAINKSKQIQPDFTGFNLFVPESITNKFNSVIYQTDNE